jgi:uncharacterized protein
MQDTAPNRPIPIPTEVSRPFWDAAARHKLIVQSCSSCNRVFMYARRYCPFCLSADVGWRDATGRGTIYTVTVQERGAPSGFADSVPYVIAVVLLEEGVRIMSNIVGAGARQAACGDPVEVDFELIEGTALVLPVFQLTRKQPAVL